MRARRALTDMTTPARRTSRFGEVVRPPGSCPPPMPSTRLPMLWHHLACALMVGPLCLWGDCRSMAMGAPRSHRVTLSATVIGQSSPVVMFHSKLHLCLWIWIACCSRCHPIKVCLMFLALPVRHNTPQRTSMPSKMARLLHGILSIKTVEF